MPLKLKLSLWCEPPAGPFVATGDNCDQDSKPLAWATDSTGKCGGFTCAVVTAPAYDWAAYGAALSAYNAYIASRSGGRRLQIFLRGVIPDVNCAELGLGRDSDLNCAPPVPPPASTGSDTIQCWGFSGQQQTAVTASTSGYNGSYRAIAAGAGHACAVNAMGDIACWGLNNYNQATAPLDAGRSWATVAAGFVHTCGIDSSGALACWGGNSFGCTEVPELQAPLTWAAVTAGQEHTCGIDGAGSLRCWGNEADNRTAVPERPGVRWAAVAAGNGHTCALDEQGTLSCWGADGAGQANTTFSSAGAPWLAVAAGGTYSCAIDRVGGVWCWGSLQVYSPQNLFQPALGRSAKWASIVASQRHACAVDTEGRMLCWGNDVPVDGAYQGRFKRND